MVFWSKKRIKNERGSSLLELALILPIITGVIFGGIEYTRALRVQQMLSAVAREAANDAFRSCALVVDQPACLSEITTRIQEDTRSVLSRAEIVLALYKKDSNSGVVRRVGIAGVDSLGYTARQNSSAFDETHTQLQNVLTTNESAAVVEVFYDYQPVVRLIPGIFLFSNNEFYEIALY